MAIRPIFLRQNNDTTPTMQNVDVRIKTLVFIVTMISSRAASLSVQKTPSPNSACIVFHFSPSRSECSMTLPKRRYPHHRSHPFHLDYQDSKTFSFFSFFSPTVSTRRKRCRFTTLNLSFFDDYDKFYSKGNSVEKQDANQNNYDSFTSTTTLDSESEPKFAAGNPNNAKNNQSNNKQRRQGRNNNDPQQKKTQENLYKILGANPTMTKPEIKKLYLTLAKQTHPDSVGYSPENIEKFNRVARAYSVLSDKQLRKRYDRELKANALTEEADEFMEEKKREAGEMLERWYDELFIPFLTKAATGYFELGRLGRLGREFAMVVLGIGGFILIRWVLVANVWLGWVSQSDVGAK